MAKIALIAAIARNNAIGYNNKLLYWLPNDLKHFKEITNGNTIIMGSNTFRSLPKGALPNRRNIVLSRKEKMFIGAEVFSSLDEALNTCDENETVFIIGGEMLYKQTIDKANVLYITEIDDIPKKADAYFPDFSKEKWEVEKKDSFKKDEKHLFDYQFITYKKISED